MKWIGTLAKLACTLSVMWAFLWSMTLANRFIVLHHQDGYELGTFTVTSLTYRRGDSDSGPSWWANGTVVTDQHRATDERFGLADLAIDPTSQGHLEQMIPLGRTFDVWFNPDVTTVMMQDETPRVMRDTPDFWGEQVRQRNALLRRALGPLAVSIGILIVVSIVRRTARWARVPPRDAPPTLE